MFCSSVGLLFLSGLLVITCQPIDKKMRIGPNGPIVSQEVSEENNDNKKKEVFKLMEDQIYDNKGKILPQKKKEVVKLMEDQIYDNTGKVLPEKIIVGDFPVPHIPGKNWGRKMNEQQWQQHHAARLNPKPHERYKHIMHNRNNIHDNRHDRKNRKIARHTD